ncbi:MAG TPA: peroxidase family protein [Acidimicrobiales bacterium]|nr:peroxidase family protein [Acidimicrobiales bacterium]
MRVALAVALGVAITAISPGGLSAQSGRTPQSLDGSGNNPFVPTRGQVGTQYLRVGPARYADGRSAPVGGPNARFVSNRIFNDTNQNIFSENGVSQWGFAWGQFLDHTFGLRQTGGPTANIPFNGGDPLESFTNTLGVIPFSRSAAAPGTGTTNARQQINTVSSYIDAWAVYGGTNERLDWLREGSLDGNPTNNSALLKLDENGLLPRRDARGDANAAPFMETDGRLIGQPGRAMTAGDVRANENIGLTATHTLFAREHNRIVRALPASLTEEQKFQIARRVVIAEQQFITYNEFLPTLGVRLPTYFGYNPGVNATLGNEFATVGYRAHSMIHGEIEAEAEAARYTPEALARLEAAGVEVEEEGDELALIVPLNVAFFNPDIIGDIQLGPLLQGLGLESQYNNDEQIDNQLRSVLFQVPVSGNPECLDGPTLPECFQGVVDLGAVDIERGRDHGMPTYNQMRQAFGLPAKSSFTSITGEATESFPSDPELTPGDEINDPDALDFVRLIGRDGQDIPLGTPEADTDAVQGIRRTTTAARLKAVYGSVNNLDAFTGMLAERHVSGTEFGELQLAMWRRQFQALRDGDRFFYLNDLSVLVGIRNTYGIDYRTNLGDVIARNTDIPRAELAANVFKAPA